MAAVVEDADHGRVRARQRTDDAAFGAAVGADGANFNQYAVAVHRGSNGVRRNEDVSSQASFETVVERGNFWNDKADSRRDAWSAGRRAGCVLLWLRNGVAIGVDLQQFSFADE